MARTAQLPGVSSKHADIDTAAEEYVKQRDKRMALTKLEVAARELLIAKMKAHDLTEYFDQEAELSVVIENQTKVKVKHAGEEDDADD